MNSEKLVGSAIRGHIRIENKSYLKKIKVISQLGCNNTTRHLLGEICDKRPYTLFQKANWG